MKIAILGGTGKLGLALARRFHRSGHQTKIGSREISKAVEAARSIDPAVSGVSNAEAAAWCDAAVVSAPYLIRSMKLNPIDAGPIEAARQLEQITVLLLSINKANKVKECGIKITGI